MRSLTKREATTRSTIKPSESSRLHINKTGKVVLYPVAAMDHLTSTPNDQLAKCNQSRGFLRLLRQRAAL